MRYEQGAFAFVMDGVSARPEALEWQGKGYFSALVDAPLFSLFALAGGERVCLMPKNGREEKGAFVYDMYAGEAKTAVRAVLNIVAQAGAVSMSVCIDNAHADMDVVETVFELSGLLFGEGQDTALLYPHHGGEKIIDPVNRLRSQKYREFWRAQSVLKQGEWTRECNYCGLCSMSYMYLQNAQAGLYVASHDSDFPVTGLFTKTGGEEHKYMSLGFRVHKRIQCGQTWRSGEFTIALSGEDWHAGAKRYRAWITPFLAPHSDPDFLKDQAALNQCYNFKRVEEIQNRFTDIPGMWEAGNAHGINHMFIASWNRTGFDSFYPEYYPDMELGTALDFRRGIDYVNAHGGFATLYVNARLSDLSSDFHKRYLSAMQIENAQGEPYVETYGPHSFTLNCPSDEKWQHDLVDICDFAAQAYGFKGIYLDQLASAEPFACYNEQHSHEDVGAFNRGYVKILSELRARLTARDKDAYLMTENCGDIYSAYTWGNLTWNGAEYDEFYNMFRYTFPEFVQVNMCNDRSWAEDAVQREYWFYRDVERCVLMGNILWIGITSRYQTPALKAHFDYLMAATAFRKAIAPMVSKGTYVDDRYVTRLDAGLNASSFDLGQASLLLVGSADKAAGEAVFTLPYAVKCAQAYDETGAPVEIKVNQNTLTVPMRTSRLVRVHVSGAKEDA